MCDIIFTSINSLASIPNDIHKIFDVHITQNGILHSYKKECIWVSPNKVDESRAYYTEWSKSERERQILYINICMWNLEATVRTLYWTTDCFKIDKGIRQGWLLSPYLFNLYAEHMRRNARPDELQAGIKIGGRNNQQPQICRWYHSNGRKWRGTKEPLDEGDGGEWKSWHKIKY